MINFLNLNQGFVMAILTLVYVVATIAICISNWKSAKASTAQLKEMKEAQIQNVKVQLFEKRYDAYLLLCSWRTVARTTFSNIVTVPGTDILLSPAEVFRALIFHDNNNQAIKSLNDELDELSLISKNLEYDPKNIIKSQDVLTKINKLTMDIYFTVVKSIEPIKNRIDSAKYLYPDTAAMCVKEFTDAFLRVAIDISNENLNNLNNAYHDLENSGTFEKMEESLGLSLMF